MSRPEANSNRKKATEGGLSRVRRWLRILAGPLEGLRGTFVERCGPSRVLMAVDSLMHGVFVEVDESQLELIDQHFDEDC